MKLISNPRRKRECGTQVAEFAVALPLLLFLVLLVTEGAGLVRAHQVLNNIAREGARFASSEQRFQSTGSGSLDHTRPIIEDMMTYGWTNNVSVLCDGTVTAPCSAPADSVLPAPTYGPGSHSYTYTGSSSMCPSASMVMIQPIYVATATGVYITTSRIVVTCNYKLQYMPRLLGIPNTVPLRAMAEFRNFATVNP